jgi:hypothetical protein
MDFQIRKEVFHMGLLAYTPKKDKDLGGCFLIKGKSTLAWQQGSKICQADFGLPFKAKSPTDRMSFPKGGEAVFRVEGRVRAMG